MRTDNDDVRRLYEGLVMKWCIGRARIAYLHGVVWVVWLPSCSVRQTWDGNLQTRQMPWAKPIGISKFQAA